MTSRDIRFGRRGGRWANPPQSDEDAASIDAWHRKIEALEEATRLAGEQLTIDDALDVVTNPRRTR